MFDRIMRAFATVLPDSVVALAPRLVAATLALIVFWAVWRVARRGIGFFAQRAQLDQTLRRFIETLSQYVVLTIAMLTALAQLGVDVGAVLTSLGVVGLTVGFAAKDALSNVISGLFILWDRPFVIGDLVEINGFYGRVENITLRSTRVVTVDGKMLAIPNTAVVNSTVASFTNFPNLRIDVDVTVGTAEDLGRVRELLCDLATQNPAFLAEPAPRTVVTALNDYNVAMQLQVWIEDERQHIPVRFALREAIFERLREEGVDMPLERTEIRNLPPLEPKVAPLPPKVAPPTSTPPSA